jgi:2'-5' RNA ligase
MTLDNILTKRVATRYLRRWARQATVEGTVTGDGTSHVGLFIPLPAELAAQFPPLTNDTSPSHVTLLYVGTLEADRQEEFLDVLAKTLATEPGPVRAWLDGVDKFVHPADDREVFYSPVRFSRDMGMVRDRLTAELKDAGFEVANSFPLAYCPHTTLAYVDGLDHAFHGKPPTGAWEFSTVQVWGLPELHTLSLGSFVQHDMTLKDRQESGLLSDWGEMLDEE